MMHLYSAGRAGRCCAVRCGWNCCVHTHVNRAGSPLRASCAAALVMSVETVDKPASRFFEGYTP